jgi:hypothetical protein
MRQEAGAKRALRNCTSQMEASAARRGARGGVREPWRALRVAGRCAACGAPTATRLPASASTSTREPGAARAECVQGSGAATAQLR